MKKFLIKLSAFALIFLAVSVIVSVKLDPYNVFHPLNLRDNGIEPNKNYVKMTYLISCPHRFDTFIMGSSRVGFINPEKLEGARAYNMTYSSGLPREQLDNLRTMLDNGIKPENIIIGVDDISIGGDYEQHRSDMMTASYEYLTEHPLEMARLYIAPAVAMDSRNITREHQRDTAVEEDFYNYGCTIRYGLRGTYSVPERPTLVMANNMDDVLAAMAELTELCRDNGITLSVFTSPIYAGTYHGLLEYGFYYDFLRQLAAITPYYNFSGFNDVTLDPDNYMDMSHYLPEVGDLIAETVWDGKTDEHLLRQGFGFYTDRENVEELIEILENGRVMDPLAE